MYGFLEASRNSDGGSQGDLWGKDAQYPVDGGSAMKFDVQLDVQYVECPAEQLPAYRLALRMLYELVLQVNQSAQVEAENAPAVSN